MNDQPFSFNILHSSAKSHARVGQIVTPHGIIETPNFVAVGTNGTLKAVDSKAIDSLDLQLMFCNTYHLVLQPGTQTIKNAGGIHQFIGRNKPIITDSGGFQVFSLAYGGVKDELKSRGAKKNDGSVLKITEEGVLFRSYRDGKRILLTPESSVQAQKDIGADIIIPLDELPPYHIKPKALVDSLARTHRWEKRSLIQHLKNPNNQAMYAVIHGGVDKELRAQSIAELSKHSFDGYAVGGSIGKTKPEMFELLQYVFPRLPQDKPNHLLGIGDLESIDACVRMGVDTFDSSHPTRCARHGLIFTDAGNLKILRTSFAHDYTPLCADCTCTVCTHYTRAYIHHLFKAKEVAAHTLATIHNLHFMVKLMARYRQRILDGDL
jgi:queuine tRNA-ribosyltransferase